MNQPYIRSDAHILYADNPYELDAEIPDSEVDDALNGYDNAEKARCLIERDAANDCAKLILVDVLDFCDKLEGTAAINVNGAVLNLSVIRDYAYKAAFKDAYAEIEKGNL